MINSQSIAISTIVQYSSPKLDMLPWYKESPPNHHSSVTWVYALASFTDESSPILTVFTGASSGTVLTLATERTVVS